MAASRMYPKRIEQLAESAGLISALLAGMELDVFTPLESGALTANELAQQLGLHAGKTAALLEALAAVGLLNVEGGRFGNSEEADHFLVRGREAYIGLRHHAIRRRLMSSLKVADAIRSGRPQTLVDYANMPAAAREDFYRGVHLETVAAGRDFSDRVDLSGVRELADIGGGSGGFSIALAESFSNLRITVVDLPATKTVADSFINEAGLSDRISVATADIVDGEIAGTFDAAVMRGVSLVLDLTQLRKACANVFRVLRPGAPFYIVGWILDDSRLTPLGYVAHNLRFATDYDTAQLHTEEEHRTLLAEAGFQRIARDRVSNVYASDFMVAYRPGTA